MEERGWSQRRLGRELGKGQTWVSKVIRKVMDPGVLAARSYLEKVGWELHISPKTEDDDPMNRREFTLGASALFIASPKMTPFHDPEHVNLLTQRLIHVHYYLGDDSQVRRLIDQAGKVRSAAVSGGRELQSAASDFLRWGAYALRGSGRTDIATRFANDAVHLAGQAEDPDKLALGHCALIWASVFNGYDNSVGASSKNVGQAVMLARRGLKVPGIGDEPRAWLNGILACGLANAPGNEKEARTAAERALGVDTIPTKEQADILGTAGNVFRDIGERRNALKMLDEAARRLAPLSLFNQTQYLSDQIMLALDLRESDRAASAMNTLSCLVPLVDSTRITKQAQRVLEAARPWAGDSEVRQARERLRSVLSVPRGTMGPREDLGRRSG